jgi:hypothetical protein
MDINNDYKISFGTGLFNPEETSDKVVNYTLLALEIISLAAFVIIVTTDELGVFGKINLLQMSDQTILLSKIGLAFGVIGFFSGAVVRGFHCQDKENELFNTPVIPTSPRSNNPTPSTPRSYPTTSRQLPPRPVAPREQIDLLWYANLPEYQKQNVLYRPQNKISGSEFVQGGISGHNMECGFFSTNSRRSKVRKFLVDNAKNNYFRQIMRPEIEGWIQRGDAKLIASLKLDTQTKSNLALFQETCHQIRRARKENLQNFRDILAANLGLDELNLEDPENFLTDVKEIVPDDLQEVYQITCVQDKEYAQQLDEQMNIFESEELYLCYANTYYSGSQGLAVAPDYAENAGQATSIFNIIAIMTNRRIRIWIPSQDAANHVVLRAICSPDNNPNNETLDVVYNPGHYEKLLPLNGDQEYELNQRVLYSHR